MMNTKIELPEECIDTIKEVVACLNTYNRVSETVSGRLINATYSTSMTYDVAIINNMDIKIIHTALNKASKSLDKYPNLEEVKKVFARIKGTIYAKKSMFVILSKDYIIVLEKFRKELEILNSYISIETE